MKINANARIDFSALVEFRNGNPNGDPDAGNAPRQYPDSGLGFMTDGCIKRKLRNYVTYVKGDEEPYQIFIQDKGLYLATDLQREAHEAVGVSDSKKPTREEMEDATRWLVGKYWDIRVFGAVLSTGYAAMNVRGPVQFDYGQSIDPITPMDIAITRVCRTSVKDGDLESDDPDEAGQARFGTMGRRFAIEYGLYRIDGTYSPQFARQSGASEEDIALVIEGLEKCWSLDLSAARPYISCRGLWVFQHDHRLGNAPVHEVRNTISVSRKEDAPAVRFEDYEVTVSEAPSGIAVTQIA